VRVAQCAARGGGGGRRSGVRPLHREVARFGGLFSGDPGNVIDFRPRTPE
jgi:hypothetical protein